MLDDHLFTYTVGGCKDAQIKRASRATAITIANIPNWMTIGAIIAPAPKLTVEAASAFKSPIRATVNQIKLMIAQIPDPAHMMEEKRIGSQPWSVRIHEFIRFRVF